MNQVVTFDGQPAPGAINFGVGQPSADLLPAAMLAEAAASFTAAADPFDYNYGPREGDPRFLDTLAGFLTRHYGATVGPDELFVSGGNSQALDFVSTVFARPGDTVFVEEPSYFLAFQVFRDHGLNIVGIPLDGDGISIPALEQALEQHRPAFLYTIPSYQNPGGQCLPESRRRRLVELSAEHDFLIVADEVYQLLYFDEPPPPALGLMQEAESVLSLGSFSKILAPGMRLGWIQAPARLRERMQANGFINSGGSINHISSHIVRQAIELGLQDRHMETVRNAYARRAAAMHDALLENFSGMARWQRPEGGYFFWLEMEPGVDTAIARKQASAAATGFQPGSVFSSKGGLNNCLRLSFAHYRAEQMTEGVERIRSLF